MIYMVCIMTITRVSRQGTLCFRKSQMNLKTFNICLIIAMLVLMIWEPTLRNVLRLDYTMWMPRSRLKSPAILFATSGGGIMWSTSLQENVWALCSNKIHKAMRYLQSGVSSVSRLFFEVVFLGCSWLSATYQKTRCWCVGNRGPINIPTPLDGNLPIWEAQSIQHYLSAWFLGTSQQLICHPVTIVTQKSLPFCWWTDFLSGCWRE